MKNDLPKKRLTFWTTDKIIGLSALFISLLTLVVFIYQTEIMREQQHLSVLPYLTLENHYFGTENYKFVLKNSGIGPAIVKAVRVKDSLGVHDTDLYTYLKANYKEIDSIQNLAHSDIVYGMLLPAGEHLDHILLQNTPGSWQKLEALVQKINTKYLEFEIEYESIYGERWIIKMNTYEPVRLK